MHVMVRCEFRLHCIPGGLVHDGRVLSLMDPALMGEPAGIDGVCEDGVEMAPAEWLAARAPPCPIDPLGHMEASIAHVLLQGRDCAALEITGKDGPDQRGVLVHDVQG